MLNKEFDVQLSELDLKNDRIEKTRDKLDRVVDGENHGRAVYFDGENKLWYKVFHKDYIRRQNFITALEAGFYDKLAPALIGLIYASDGVVGYVTKDGKRLSSKVEDFKVIPEDFLTLLKETIKDTNLFYYDLAPLNIIKVDGKLSLIDLESVYHLDKLYDIDEALKLPRGFKDFLVKLKEYPDV